MRVPDRSNRRGQQLAGQREMNRQVGGRFQTIGNPSMWDRRRGSRGERESVGIEGKRDGENVAATWEFSHSAGVWCVVCGVW